MVKHPPSFLSTVFVLFTWFESGTLLDETTTFKSSLTLAFIGAVMLNFEYLILENYQIGSFNMSADNT